MTSEVPPAPPAAEPERTLETPAGSAAGSVARRPEILGLPAVAAGLVLLLACPAALLALLPVPDTTTVEARLLMDPRIQRAATLNFLLRLDPQELDAMVKALDAEDPVLRAAAMRAHAQTGRMTPALVEQALSDASDTVVEAALQMMEASPGRVSRRTVERLGRIGADREKPMHVRWRSLHLLSQARGPSVPAATMIDVILNGDDYEYLRSLAAQAVRQPKSADVKRLRAGLKAPDPTIRLHCVQALAAASNAFPSDLVRNALAEAAGSADDNVVVAAAQALQNVGKGSRAAAIALRDAAVATPRDPMKVTILGALRTIGIDEDLLTAEFIALSDSRNVQVRSLAEQIRKQAR